MYEATILKFRERPPGSAPISAQHHVPGNSLRTINIEDAPTAKLYKDAEAVLVQFIQKLDDGTYIGEISGFEPSLVLEFNEMKVGEPIRFSEQHVFGLTE